MNRFLALTLLLSLASLANAQTNTDPNRGVNRLGAKQDAGHAGGGRSGENHAGGGQDYSVPPLPKFSGNLPSTINQDRTHGVNAPGTMIGPQPENGEPDPRFAGDRATAGGGGEINAKSSSTGASQTGSGTGKMTGAGELPSGGTTSNLNEGLPSASKDNSGGNAGGASGGTGGGAGGSEYNAGGDARPGQGAAQSTNSPSDVGRETAGAAPYPIIAGAVILAAFLYSVMRKRGRSRV